MKLQEGRLRRRRGKGSLLYRTPFPEADKLGKYSMHLYPTAATKSLQRLLNVCHLATNYNPITSGEGNIIAPGTRYQCIC